MDKNALHRPSRGGFTLMELLASIAIVAVLTSMAVVFVGNYIKVARETTTTQTVAILNDALNQYKALGGLTQGSSLSGFSSGVLLGKALDAMKAGFTSGGLRRSFIRTGQTIDTTYIGCTGQGKTFAFLYNNTAATGSGLSLTPGSYTAATGETVSFSASGGRGTGAYVWGGTAGATGSASATSVNFPTAGSYTVTVYRQGDSSYADSSATTATVVVKDLAVTTLIGNGSAGSADGAGAAGRVSYPNGLGIDGAGNVYVADTNNNRIRKITISAGVGTISTVAGSTNGYVDAVGAAARFKSPRGVGATSDGSTLYVADTGNNMIRKISISGGTATVTTFAGQATGGYADGTGGAAQFSGPRSVVVGSDGTVYVADTGNNRIRKITPAGVVTTLAGAAGGYADGNGTSAQFNGFDSLGVDANGTVYTADTNNFRLRQITAAGDVTTVAGISSGYADGIGSAARFSYARGSAAGPSGVVYVADTQNNKIRKVIVATGAVSTLAGGTASFADGSLTTSRFNWPWGIVVDAAGNIYVADANNNRIRKIAYAP